MIKVFNLRGNQRTSGDLSRREGGKIFGSGSRTPIAITLLVRNPAAKGKAQIHYHDIGDYLSREEKLERIKKFASVMSPEMQLSSITPNEENDWLNQRDGLFDTFIPIVAEKKYDCSAMSFFILNTRGLETSRDSIVYSSSQEGLSRNVHNMIVEYNAQRIDFQEIRRTKEIKVEDFVKDETKEIIWTRGTRNDLDRNIAYSYDEKSCRIAMYRPFFKQFAYFSSQCNEYVNQWPKIFPTPQTKNLVICVSGLGGSKEHSVFISNRIIDLNCLDSGTQCFPMFYFEKVKQDQPGLFDFEKSDYSRRDGISDFILERARALNPKITKENIFYYVYGILHNPDYIKRFSADLKKTLPRIPLPEEYWIFKAYCKAGEELAKLHLNYEDGELCRDVIVSGCEYGDFRVKKMRFISKDDKRTILLNERIKIENIPLSAYDYIINGKSAIEWVMEKYAITINAESGILNDPNKWSENPRYILDLLLRVIQMSTETRKIIAKLPKLYFPG